MKRIRLRVIILVLWLIILYYAERLLNSTAPNSLAFPFLLVAVVFALALPRLTRTPFWIVLIAQIILFYSLKELTGAHQGPYFYTLSIIEVCAISSSSVLAHWVSLSLGEFETAVQNILVGYSDKVPEPTTAGQGSLYREVRRARNHQRPLTLMAIAMEENSSQTELDRITKEAILAMARQYRLANLSRTLCDELEDCTIIVQTDEHFVVALPETTREDLPFVVKRLRKQAADKVGIKLKVGVATLPEDSFTYEGLIDKATREMQANLEVQQYFELEEKSLERSVP